MRSPEIVSMMSYQGAWVRQEDLPQKTVNDLAERALKQAGAEAGFEVKRAGKEEKSGESNF